MSMLRYVFLCYGYISFAIEFKSVPGYPMARWLTVTYSASVPTLSTVSAARATRARASSRAHLARNHREIASYFVLVRKIFAEVPCVS